VGFLVDSVQGQPVDLPVDLQHLLRSVVLEGLFLELVAGSQEQVED
jgi:hypothetical protein